MIELALSPEEEQKRNQTMQMQQAPLAAPQAPRQEKGMAGQMMDMAKQRAMEGALDVGQEGIMQGIGSLAGPSTAQMAGLNALAPATGGLAPGAAQAVMGNTALAGTTGAQLASGAAGAGGMAAIGTAVPYIGAGLLAGKALGLFNQGGPVGPLSAMYKAGGGMSKGYNYKRPRYSPSQGIDEANLRAMQDKKDLEEALMISAYDSPVGIGSGLSADYFIDTPYSYNRKTQYKAGGGMTEQQAMALMNNQPDPDQLYDEIVAESMTEAAQGQMPQYQTMPPTQKVMPMIGPLSVDPMGADTTYSDEMYKSINT